jgi:hypothetical protein
MEFSKGQEYKIDLCGHTGRIIWISKDGRTIGVKCPNIHYSNPMTGDPYPDNGSSDHVRKRDIVYLIGVE